MSPWQMLAVMLGLLVGCSAKQSTSLRATGESRDGTTLDLAQTELLQLVEATETHVLAVAVSHSTEGLYWIESTTGHMSRAELPVQIHEIRSIQREGTRTYAIGEGQGSESPTARVVLEIDRPSRNIRVLSTPGNWSALTVHEGALDVALLASVTRIDLEGDVPVQPRVVGEWIYNETRWLSWYGQTLVSTVDGSDHIVTWRSGEFPKFLQIPLQFPVRYLEYALGISNGNLVTWSPSQSLAVVIPSFVASYGELVAPMIVREGTTWALTERSLLALDVTAGTVVGKYDINTSTASSDVLPVPSFAVGADGVWRGDVLTTCNGGRLSIQGEPFSAGRCVPRSRLTRVRVSINHPQ